MRTHYCDSVAFPTDNDSERPGMSLRDYFAAKGLPVLTPLSAHELQDDVYASAAKCAYRMSDAMLKVRDE